MPDKCSTCIFRPGDLMHIGPARLKDMVSCADEGGVIPCHKTTYGQREQEAVCRGFFDAYSDKVMGLRLAIVMDMIEEVEPS